MSSQNERVATGRGRRGRDDLCRQPETTIFDGPGDGGEAYKIDPLAMIQPLQKSASCRPARRRTGELSGAAKPRPLQRNVRPLPSLRIDAHIAT